MAILNIRGTSGSGKSTLVHRILANYGGKVPYYVPNRKQPLYYTYQHPSGGPPLAVLGHYETACGGCDTIPAVADAFALVEMMALFEGCDVLFEGLLIAADVNRTVAIHELLKGRPDQHIAVIALSTNLDLCVESVNLRRRAKDPTKPDVSPKNTASKYRGVELSIPRLRKAGIPVHVVDRQAAYFIASKIFDLPADELKLL